MDANEVHIIPFPGKPLMYDTSASTYSLFPGPQHGYLVGQENHALEPVIRWVIEGGILVRDQLPILFYGGSGCGKTHLLNGIFDEWQKKHARAGLRRKALFITADDFARRFSEAVATRTMDDFRHRYRGASLLVIDDIDRLSGKNGAQDELQYTLDSLAVEGGTAVLSAKRFPLLDGKLFSTTLADRLFAGTTLSIFFPGEAVRTHFLVNLASSLRLELSESSLRTVARQLPLSIPALYGIVAGVFFEASSKRAKIDAVYMSRFLLNRSEIKRPTMEEVTRRTAKHFSLKVADLRGKSRKKSVALARSVAVYLVRRLTGVETKEIATYFGGRDPSTIRHLIERIRDDVLHDVVLRDHLFRLEEP